MDPILILPITPHLATLAFFLLSKQGSCLVPHPHNIHLIIFLARTSILPTLL